MTPLDQRKGISERLDCLVAGEANVDLLVEGGLPLERGKEKIARDMQLVLGGSSAITAHNLARLGARVGFVGIIGDDFLGRFVEEELASAGVDITAVRRHPRERTGITVWHGRGRQRSGVTYPGTVARLSAKEIPDSFLGNARHLHVGAYFLQKGLHPGAPALFHRAQRLGLTTSLDCNFDPAERWNSGVRRVLPYVDVFFPNEDEARQLTGCRGVREAARSLALLCRIVAVKMGRRGAYICSSGESFQVSALNVRVADTIGAGDSFNAGFLHAFLGGAGLRACADSAIRASARCVRGIGGTSAFRKTDLASPPALARHTELLRRPRHGIRASTGPPGA